MPRNYVKKDTRKTYSDEVLSRAMALLEEGQSLRSVSKNLGIEKMFLYRYRKKNSVGSPECRKVGRRTALPPEVENTFGDHLKLLAKWGFALGKKEVLLTVKDYVEANGMVVPFKDGMPGDDWFHNFCHRQKLSLKSLEPLEKSRRVATGDPFTVYGFYDVLEEQIAALGLSEKPQNIHNLDETSFCSDSSRVKGLSGIGQKAHRYTAGSGRDNTTVLACCSASGEVLPPLIVFQGRRLWSTWKGSNDIPGTFYAATDNGWMTSAVFLEWFIKFCELVKDRPLLVIFDGHLTHLDMETVKYAMSQNVTIIKLPPHTTDVLQPLDKACFRPLKYKWDTSLLSWTRSNQRKLQKHEFVDLLCKVWPEGLTAENVRSGFQSTGIYPPNRSKYPVTRFDPIKYKRYLTHRSRSDEVSMPSEVGLNPDNSMDNNTGKQQSILSMTEPSTSGDRPRPASFETLLLDKIGRSESPAQKRRRVDSSAKVITSEEYLNEIQKAFEKKSGGKKKHKHSNEEVGLMQEMAMSAEDEDSENESDVETEPQTCVELQEPSNLKSGDFLLAMFKGGRRGCTTYKYVVTIDSVLENDEFRVIGLKSDGDKKTFKMVDNDVSVIRKSDILGVLPVPNVLCTGGRFKYTFISDVDVFEQQ